MHILLLVTDSIPLESAEWRRNIHWNYFMIKLHKIMGPYKLILKFEYSIWKVVSNILSCLSIIIFINK